MAKSPILGAFSTARSSDAADNQAINLCLEVTETQDGIVPGFLYGASGLDIIGSLGLFGLVSGRVASGGGDGYAVGDIIYLIKNNGVGAADPVLRVTDVFAGHVTAFAIMSGGSFTVKPTTFTQHATSGSGVGFSLDTPIYATIGPIRGVLPLGDILYVVSGPEVWSVTPNGIATLLSDATNQLSDATTPVSMFKNTTQLMIVDGVGAWLVPGGLPLSSGLIDSPGGLYAVNDTITLKATTGFQSAYPIIRVTSIADHMATAAHLGNAGTTYATGTSATSNLQPNPGNGTGLTLDLTAVAGEITAAVVNAGGTNYAVNNTGAITGGGSQDAVYLVTGVSGGAVTSLVLLNHGSGYGTGTAVATRAIPGNMSANAGIGLTFTITAAGPITASTIANGGRGYATANYGYLTAGTGDATYIIDAVSPIGAVTGFTIITPGAIKDEATSFIQKSTTGSGSGFTLKSPTYGAFVGLVPVEVPFPQPLVGGTTDGFGVLVFRNRQEIAASDELDLSTWQPLSFGIADQSPDNCVSLGIIHNEVFILKEDNTEVWIDEGLADFPLGPLTSAHIQFGCMAPFSVAKADSELIWLSRNSQGQGIVVAAKGYNAVPISTQALVAEFQKYSNLGDAIAYTRQEGQHVFYVITFPEANRTWQYDKTSSTLLGHPVWTQLSSGPQLDNGDFPRHWGNAFTPWTGTIALQPIVTTYQPLGVTINSPTELDNTALTGLPVSFDAFVLSLWLDMPDDMGHGIIITNQDDETLGTTNPGLYIKIQNDTQGMPQVRIKAWDAGNTALLTADYDFATWGDWVNIQISVGSTTNQISVFANTLVSGLPVQQELTGLLTWGSTAPMANPAGHSWRVIPA